MTKPNNWLVSQRQHFEKTLTQRLATSDDRLHQAMRYTTLNGGKRLRPLLVYATGLAFDSALADLDPAAVAIELIHCYSLVHDDLPAMDDDDLRRGKPSCHKAYDEATAILVGDALQTGAFEVLSANPALPNALRQIHVLSNAAGSNGMIGGQVLDIAAEGKDLSIDELKQIHTLKTAKLFSAAIQMGALAANCLDEAILETLDHAAHHLGLAFQIRDDILDITASTEILGKTAGKDVQQDKATYPALLGLEQSRKEFQHQLAETKRLLSTALPNTEHFNTILKQIELKAETSI